MDSRIIDDQIMWEEPPPIPRRVPSDEWKKRLMPLTERPGEWARVVVFDHPKKAVNLAVRLRRKPDAIPPGAWEFRGSADMKEGTSSLYARFLAPAAENAKP